MTTAQCGGCGCRVQIAGGIANLWTFGGDESGGLTLELADGSEFLLCYDCIEKLPDDPSRGDVETLAEA